MCGVSGVSVWVVCEGVCTVNLNVVVVLVGVETVRSLLSTSSTIAIYNNIVYAVTE